MKAARAFMITIGVFYFLNLALLWPGVFGPQMQTMYPDVQLYQGEPVFQLLQDAWFVVGIGLAAIGSVLLWGARKPAEYYKGLVLVVMMTEFLFGFWDAYSAGLSYEVAWMAVVTIVVHLLIIGWGLYVLRVAEPRTMGSPVLA